MVVAMRISITHYLVANSMTLKLMRMHAAGAEALAGALLLLALWQLAYSWQLISPRLLPAPAETFSATLAGLRSGVLVADLLSTLERTLLAIGIGLLGVPLGTVLGYWPRAYRLVEFPIEFFRSTPATAIFPLGLLVFGVGDLVKISVAAFSSGLVVAFNMAYGVMNARKPRVLAARSMGARPLSVLFGVVLPDALPQCFVGLRSAVSLALIVIVVGEMFIGSDQGLGLRIIEAQNVFDAKTMYAAILLTGTVGYLLNWTLLLLERRIVHWKGV